MSWLNLSLGGNVLLVAVLVGAGTRQKQREIHKPELIPQEETSPVTKLKNPSASAVHAPPPAPQPDAFNWSCLESPDYRVYAANLRTVGCPPDTVHDIITADVNALYHLKVKALVDTVQSRFWDLVGDKEAFEQMIHEKYRELQALDNEREILLEEVLGAGHEKQRPQQQLREWTAAREHRRLLDFLSPEKIDALLDLERAFAERRTRLRDAQPPMTAEQRQQAFKTCQADEDAARAQLLSAAESDEYQLRSSPAARIRLEAPAFEATEEQLKAIVGIRTETAAEAAKATNGRQGAQVQAIENQRLKDRLGEKRFAEYQRARDCTFQQLCELAELCELPGQTAVTVYDARLAADDDARRLRQDQSITKEQRAAGLQAIATETARWVQETLGERAFRIYRSREGAWLESLAAMPK